MSVRERYVHSEARFVVEAQLARFLDGPARGLDVWDFGGGAPPLRRSRPLWSLDLEPGARPSVRADLERPPLRPGSVAAGVSIAVLEHVRRPRLVVARMAEALAPGAPLFVWVPFLHETHGYPVDLWRFTDTGIRELLEDAGLETRECHAKGLTGGTAVLRHLYRFVLPPRAPGFGLRLAGYAALEALAPLDRWVPMPELPIGITWVGSKPLAAGAEP